MTIRKAIIGLIPAAAFAIGLAGCGGGGATAANNNGANAPSKAVSSSGKPKPAILTSGSTSAVGSAGTITTTGTGTANGTPDTIVINIDISTSAPHASDALSQNNAITSRVEGVLHNDGVAMSGIQAGNVSLYYNSGPTPPAGFQVDDNVQATLHVMSIAGKAIDDAIAAAGDAGRLSGVYFSISNTSAVMAAARQQAVAQARVQAEQLAADSGEKLGQLVSITDQPQNDSGGSYKSNFAIAGAAGASAPVPVQPGSQQLSVQIQTVWAVGP